MPRGRSSSSGRSSGGGRSFGGGRSAPSRSPPTQQRTAPTPQRTAAPTTPAPTTGGGMMGSMGQTVMTGMAFGAGSEIAHQAVKSVMGGGSGG